MKITRLHLIFLLAVSACDTPPPELDQELREETGAPMCPDTCGYVEPTPPIDNSACSCDLDKPDTCGLGLDCVPWGKEGRCLAKCFGSNELGGGYVNSCAEGKVACDHHPFGYPGPSYCPVCQSCQPTNPLSLICQ